MCTTQALYLAMHGMFKTRQQASVLCKILVEYLTVVSENITKQSTVARCFRVEHYSGVHSLCHKCDQLRCIVPNLQGPLQDGESVLCGCNMCTLVLSKQSQRFLRSFRNVPLHKRDFSDVSILQQQIDRTIERKRWVASDLFTERLLLNDNGFGATLLQ